MPLLLTLLIFIPSVALAQDVPFVPLAGIPFVDTTANNTTLGAYVNALYLAAISIAAFLAVVKIIFAGVQYMLSEVVTSKEKAKKSIYGAIIGLLIVLGAFLILNTINPQLTGLTNLDGPSDFNLGSGDVRVVVGGEDVVVPTGPTPVGQVTLEVFDAYCRNLDGVVSIQPIGGVANYVCGSTGNETDTESQIFYTDISDDIQVANKRLAEIAADPQLVHLPVGNSNPYDTDDEAAQADAIAYCVEQGGNRYEIFRNTTTNESELICVNAS